MSTTPIPTQTDTDILTFEQAEAAFNAAVSKLQADAAVVAADQTVLAAATTAYQTAIAKLQADLTADAGAASGGTPSN